MATITPFELKRHSTRLSEKDTEAVVAAAADLIVDFLKGNRESAQPSNCDVATAGPEIQP